MTPERLPLWSAALVREVLLNCRGLSDADKQDVDDARAIALMVAHPAMIRRPVLVRSGYVEAGFSEPRYAAVGIA